MSFLIDRHGCRTWLSRDLFFRVPSEESTTDKLVPSLLACKAVLQMFLSWTALEFVQPRAAVVVLLIRVIVNVHPILPARQSYTIVSFLQAIFPCWKSTGQLDKKGCIWCL